MTINESDLRVICPRCHQAKEPAAFRVRERRGQDRGGSLWRDWCLRCRDDMRAERNERRNYERSHHHDTR